MSMNKPLAAAFAGVLSLFLVSAVEAALDNETAMAAAPATTQTAQATSFGGMIASDFSYLTLNSVQDGVDIVTSPMHIPALFTDHDSILRRPMFYYTLLGAGAVLGGSFALDQTVRARLRSMPNNVANYLEYGGLTLSGASTIALYGYGLYEGDAKTRQYAMTGGESAVLSLGASYLFKFAFARLRPDRRKGAYKFADGGDSFVSAETAPAFAMATAISDSADNQWFVAIPAYSTATAVGIGRMGHDKHWLSDVVSGALLGIATTKLLEYLHKRHEESPNSFQLFPVATSHEQGIGLGFAF